VDCLQANAGYAVRCIDSCNTSGLYASHLAEKASPWSCGAQLASAVGEGVDSFVFDLSIHSLFRIFLSLYLCVFAVDFFNAQCA